MGLGLGKYQDKSTCTWENRNCVQPELPPKKHLWSIPNFKALPKFLCSIFATFTASCDFRLGNFFWIWVTDQVLSISEDSPNVPEVIWTFPNISEFMEDFRSLWAVEHFLSCVQTSATSNNSCLPRILRPNVKKFWRVWTQVLCIKEVKNTQKQ